MGNKKFFEQIGFFADIEAHRNLLKRSKIKKKHTPVKSFTHPCEICGLCENSSLPKVNYTGKGNKKILIIDEVPGNARADQLLKSLVESYGLDIERDCWKTYAINCLPKNPKHIPTKKEIKLCHFKIEEAIEQCKPKFIWLLGSSAIGSFYQGRFSKTGVTRWSGYCVPDRLTNAWIFPMYSPSDLVSKKDANLEMIFDRDFKRAFSCLHKKPPQFIDFESRVECLTSADEIIPRLTKILNERQRISFDYETSGLKPYIPGSKIWSISVGSFEECISFPYDYPGILTPEEKNEIAKIWKEILLDPRIGNVNHNSKFEDIWSREIFGVEARGYTWCTQLATHILDSRSGIKSLEFQALRRYGVLPYDEEVKKFKKPRKGELFNRLDQVPIEKLLLYGGLDQTITDTLFEDQKLEFERKNSIELKKAFRFFQEGLSAFADSQEEGICVDEEYYKNQDKILEEEISELTDELMEGDEAELFFSKTNPNRKLKLNSPKDLRELLFDFLQVKSIKKTDKKNDSVDYDVLSSIDIPFTTKLIRLRRLKKVKDTYLAQFLRETQNGKINPFFDLDTARTFRGSASRPNFQNIPIREEEAKRIVRCGIIPSRGNKLCEADYSGHETRVLTCYTQDPEMVKYFHTPGVDVHVDQASLIFLIDDDPIMATLKPATKSNFVFATVYGSYYKNTARNLWEECIDLKTKDGISILTHLKEKGVITSNDIRFAYKQFQNHVKAREDDFWDRFKVTKKWQKKVLDLYLQKGYVESFFGHRRSGYLSKNEVINTPIQGTGFHCLLWSYIQLNQIRKEEKWLTKIVAQIHDSIFSDLNPEEQEMVFRALHKVMVEDIRKEFPWIIVPLQIGIDLTEIDQAWYYKKEIND